MPAWTIRAETRALARVSVKSSRLDVGAGEVTGRNNCRGSHGDLLSWKNTTVARKATATSSRMVSWLFIPLGFCAALAENNSWTETWHWAQNSVVSDPLIERTDGLIPRNWFPGGRNPFLSQPTDGKLFFAEKSAGNRYSFPLCALF
jgi:hypothetical protein